jgi:hypothetical protein
MEMYVVKGNGEKVVFDLSKLKRALASSGAGEQEQERIAKIVSSRIYNGITTKKIYQMAFDLLKRKSHRIAGRYRLKSAIMELGPTGYPFEIFVGKILEKMGYEVETGKIIQGKCIQHEVNVIAQKPGERIMIECKFHQNNQTKSGVQVPLYIQSRYLDIKSVWEQKFGKNISYRGGVVTNTRFSEDAIKYGKCAGLMLISWDYPAETGLKYFIDRTGLHPVTSLISISKKEKQILLEKGIVLCSQLVENQNVLKEVGISHNKIKKAIREAENLIAI